MQKKFSHFDVVIIGAGIMGLSIARALKEKNRNLRIAVVEKESALGLHASGRNSGVLHSGIYYPENTLKANFCRQGALLLADYCEEYQLPIKRIGKIILPTRASDSGILKILHQRAINNGAKVYLIDNHELKKIEPEAKAASDLALVSPETAVVDPKAILRHLFESLEKQQVHFYFKSHCFKINTQARQLQIGNELLSYGHVYNCAGLYADKLAHLCGLDEPYTMLPFRGSYYALNKNTTIKINHLIYPVPDLNVPFLGVHTTQSIDGTTFFGPTALPVLGRENYVGLQGIKWSEAVNAATTLAKQYLYNNQGFRKYTHAEVPRLLKVNFLKSAQVLIPRLQKKDLVQSSKTGIRAQLVNTQKRELIMDFLVADTKNETHILNAVSPGFTSAFSFSRYIVNRI